MNEISFPGLGLNFRIDPVAFTVFGREIFWYGIIIAIGFSLAVAFCLHREREFGIESDDLLDMLIFAVPAAIVFARIYYIIFYLDQFLDSEGKLILSKLYKVHDGGIAIYGAIIGAVLAAWLVMRHKKVPFLAMADLGAYGLLIGQIVGRFGNFVNAEAYGGETTAPWRMGIYEWSGGAYHYVEVHPTFLYESLWNLIGFVLLLVLLKKGYRKFDGAIFFTYIAWYGVGRSIIEGMRTDSLYFFSTGLRVSQWVGILSAVIAVGYLIYRFRQRPGPDRLYVNQKKRMREEPSDGSDNP